MVGVPMLKAERISCPDPKLSDAQTRNFEAIKHSLRNADGADYDSGWGSARKRHGPRGGEVPSARRGATPPRARGFVRDPYALFIESMRPGMLCQADWWVERCPKWRRSWADLLEGAGVVDGRHQLTHERLSKVRPSVSGLVSRGPSSSTWARPWGSRALPRINNQIEGGVNTRLGDILRGYREPSLACRAKAMFWWCHAPAEGTRPASESLHAPCRPTRTSTCTTGPGQQDSSATTGDRSGATVPSGWSSTIRARTASGLIGAGVLSRHTFCSISRLLRCASEALSQMMRSATTGCECASCTLGSMGTSSKARAGL